MIGATAYGMSAFNNAATKTVRRLTAPTLPFQVLRSMT